MCQDFNFFEHCTVHRQCFTLAIATWRMDTSLEFGAQSNTLRQRTLVLDFVNISDI
jgi:hypothetical protein